MVKQLNFNERMCCVFEALKTVCCGSNRIVLSLRIARFCHNFVEVKIKLPAQALVMFNVMENVHEELEERNEFEFR